jgi:hypothetical protein
VSSVTEDTDFMGFLRECGPLCRAVFEADPNWRRAVRATAKFALKAIKRKK